MRRFDTPVLENRELCRDYRRLSFAWPGDAGLPDPGRFLTVRASAASDPLLRRPFAFSGYDPGSGSASFIYQVRGPATRLLSALGPGAFLDVLGPLGRGFPDPPREAARCSWPEASAWAPCSTPPGTWDCGRLRAAGRRPSWPWGSAPRRRFRTSSFPRVRRSARTTDPPDSGAPPVDWASGVDSGGRYGPDGTPSTTPAAQRP
ncbi:MAG: hypothetical protein M0C28_43340 [Candidatus Moduliflexus flocculans]|nr:hypothetical protein [Candidatus Moduliflexus flocculans]